MIDRIDWLGHSSVRIGGERVIYIDPWKLVNPPKADIVLISHSHHDHFSPQDIKKLSDDTTEMVATADCLSPLKGKAKAVGPGDVAVFGAIRVEAVAAYNVNKVFHPKENRWVGFVITVAGFTIYYAGDTDAIPEMKDIHADVVIVPVGGTYTMTAEEAAEAVNLMNPKAAIPVHYGDIVGTADDAARFSKLCRSRVVLKTVVSA